MFRLPQADPAEEQKRVKAEVRGNFFVFGALCVAIRLAPIVLQKLNTA
ncbi:uncharacterized protein LOC115623201 [Scaptodrosophila lebanonensis]|uniref:Uncharacterized protein LOC115623201 n=1 Tax=Drosophila lebanonensis TaxID=7225 RepID=A0A6J2TD20_DROLE|nr:uncharacterized protein LOC115623201 [Scaptodrosophila lebanonensis]